MCRSISTRLTRWICRERQRHFARLWLKIRRSSLIRRSNLKYDFADRLTSLAIAANGAISDGWRSYVAANGPGGHDDILNALGELPQMRTGVNRIRGYRQKAAALASSLPTDPSVAVADLKTLVPEHDAAWTQLTADAVPSAVILFLRAAVHVHRFPRLLQRFALARGAQFTRFIQDQDWLTPVPLSSDALALLNRIEALEMRSLGLGFTSRLDGRGRTDGLLGDEIQAEDALEELIEAHLVVERPSLAGGRRYRSRFAEAVRLLAANRQLFANKPWQAAPRLVADFRIDRRSRRFPRRRPPSYGHSDGSWRHDRTD